MKYRLEEIKPAASTLADVPEGEPVDCINGSHVEKMMRVGTRVCFVRIDGTAGCPTLFSLSSIPLWRPTAKPLPTTTDQLEADMVAVDYGGCIHRGPTIARGDIASPIYRVVEVKP